MILLSKVNLYTSSFKRVKEKERESTRETTENIEIVESLLPLRERRKISFQSDQGIYIYMYF